MRGASNSDISEKAVSKKTHLDVKNVCKTAPETQDIIVDDKNGEVQFNNKFTCLGSIADFRLDDTEDANSRITKASKAMGALSFIWNASNTPVDT